MSVSRDSVRIERVPNSEDQNFGWSIKRANHDHPSMLTALSSDFFGVRTHFYRGRTGPCLKTDCEACARHQLSRWSGYLLAVDRKDHARVIFEFTPQAVNAFELARKEYGTLRGINFIAERKGKKVNGRVALTCRGMDQGAHALPAEVDIWFVLSHIWGLNRVAPAKFQEFTPEGLAEAERIQNDLVSHANGHDDDWIKSRAADLAGQLVLPMSVNGHSGS